ncbi:hypothetical protein GCM10010124_26520 [Pilimelia terevasa]|uniref:Uncharacterized protein n=1 Tax=Pilimelia terevasa TaxID=53372 RepID=A0A8J3BMQ5_9ACTN|nr:hypothetical protein GCM10010124_26520 [Pilimelia terevasa]
MAAAKVRTVVPAVELRPGDEVRTPSLRWEKVATATRAGRHVRVVTDGTGPDYPWLWVCGHRLTVRRRMTAVPPAVAA